jgi:hypothetical protein
MQLSDHTNDSGWEELVNLSQAVYARLSAKIELVKKEQELKKLTDKLSLSPAKILKIDNKIREHVHAEFEQA